MNRIQNEVLVMVDFLFGSPFNEFSKLAAGYAWKDGNYYQE